MIRGGIVSELHVSTFKHTNIESFIQNLLLHGSSALDMFQLRPIPTPSETAFSIRLYRLADTVCWTTKAIESNIIQRALYDLIKSTLDDGLPAESLETEQTDLVGDRFLGAYLSYGPEHVFVLEVSYLSSVSLRIKPPTGNASTRADRNTR